MRTHAIYSHDSDSFIRFFENFNPEAIKTAIIEHLTENPRDMVEHCKEYSKADTKKYYGMEILNFYKVGKSGKVCKVVMKGSNELLKPIQ